MDYLLNKPGWFPAALKYAESIGHVSNYPLAYVLATFFVLSGHILGRRTFIRYATPLYPNSYVCLVGPSALSHKSTAINLALESLGDIIDEMPPIRSLTTSQGLLQAMLNGGGNAFVVLDELANLLSKKRQDYAADLMARLVELYSCPRTAGNYTRYEPLEVSHTFLTLLTGSTTEWLRSGLTASDLMAGFGNRMTFVLGDPRKVNPWPKAPFWANLQWERITEYEGEIRLDGDAREYWDKDFYPKFDEKQQASTPFVRVLAERIPEKILKAAIVMTAWRNTDLVDLDILQGAVDWGRYLHASVERLTPSFEVEDKQVLASIQQGHNTRPKLFGALSHQIALRRVREACDNLRWLGLVKETDGFFQIIDKPTRK
jgi:hypothetical protein